MPDSPALYELSYPWLPAEDHLPVACCVCGGKGETREVSHFSVNGKRFAIVECLADDLMYLSPQPGGRYAAALYGHLTYYEGSDDMYGMATSDEKSAAIAALRIEELLKYHGPSGPFLELGSAHGHVLEAAARAGFVPVIGVEYGSEAVARCLEKGLDARQGSLDDGLAATVGDERFAVIALYSVLEHVRDPRRLLKELGSLLAPGGIAVVRVPDTPRNGPRLSLLDHFWHFNERGLRSLVRSLGFSVEAAFPSGTFKGIGHPDESLSSVTLVLSRYHEEPI